MHLVANDVSRFTQFQAHLETKGSLCLFENTTSTKAISGNKAWKKFYENITSLVIQESKDIALIGPYTLQPDKPTRSGDHVATISALVFDIDHAQGKSFEEIANLIPPVAGIIHTTHSHQSHDPRYRVILPLNTPVPASQFTELRTNFYGGVDGKFGLSEKALIRKIDEYVADGLVTIPVRSPMSLTNKGQETLNLSGLSGQHPGK